MEAATKLTAGQITQARRTYMSFLNPLYRRVASLCREQIPENDRIARLAIISLNEIMERFNEGAVATNLEHKLTELPEEGAAILRQLLTGRIKPENLLTALLRWKKDHSDDIRKHGDLRILEDLQMVLQQILVFTGQTMSSATAAPQEKK